MPYSPTSFKHGDLIETTEEYREWAENNYIRHTSRDTHTYSKGLVSDILTVRHTDTKEPIHNYAKQIFKDTSITDLIKDLSTIDEKEFYLNYDEIRDNGINYHTFISIIQTCIFLKSNQNYSVFDVDSFFEAYSLFPN